jgi:tetratricopeptide (TPR) repeat protein
MTGHLADGIERLENLLQEQRVQRPDSSDIALHFYIALCQQITGDSEAAMTVAREGLGLSERTGAPLGLVYAYQMLGMAHALRDAMPEAVDWFERAVRLVRESRVALREESHIMASLADAKAGAGELAGARKTAEQSIDLSRQRHSGWSEVVGLLVLARILLRHEDTGTHGAIQEALADSANLIESIGHLAYRPLVHVERAELARQRGDQATRERELRQAKQLFAEMGASIRVAQIARELES